MEINPEKPASEKVFLLQIITFMPEPTHGKNKQILIKFWVLDTLTMKKFLDTVEHSNIFTALRKIEVKDIQGFL